MKLAVGELVVYRAYGIGVVLTRERRVVLGVEQDVVVLEFADGLVVSFPLERAREQLRAPLSEAVGLREVRDALRDPDELSSEVWLKRKRETEQKLAGGEPCQLAEVVRDGARRKQLLVDGKPSARLSVGENELYERARRLLSGEIGVACGFDSAQANAWIDAQLAAAAP